MIKVKLGNTGIEVNKNGFGALPIQRTPLDEAVRILRKAYDNGINFFDSAHAYTDSEAKIGAALHDVRDKVFLASKAMVSTPESLLEDLETSLKNMQTDYLDLFQFHMPTFCPKPGDGSGLYEAVLKAKEQGKIRHIGITCHLISVANEAVDSGLYETMQFPFSYLADEKDFELMEKCGKVGMGFIAMKSLAGGLITNSAAAYAYLAQFPHVLPIWGIQKESELDEFLSYDDNPPALTDEILSIIEHDKKELAGEFCRGCAYCVPSCPAGIEINNCARMSLLMRRAPLEPQLSQKTQDKMKKIDDCIDCGNCIKACPYSLNTPELLRKNYQDYKEVLAGKAL